MLTFGEKKKLLDNIQWCQTLHTQMMGVVSPSMKGQRGPDIHQLIHLLVLLTEYTTVSLKSCAGLSIQDALWGILPVTSTHITSPESFQVVGPHPLSSLLAAAPLWLLHWNFSFFHQMRVPVCKSCQRFTLKANKVVKWSLKELSAWNHPLLTTRASLAKQSGRDYVTLLQKTHLFLTACLIVFLCF